MINDNENTEMVDCGGVCCFLPVFGFELGLFPASDIELGRCFSSSPSTG
jgi:hypothetical protein